MNSLIEKIKFAINIVLTKYQLQGDFEVEVPNLNIDADLFTNAALAFAKKAGIAPQLLAAEFAEQIKQLDFVTNVSVAGPGFINISVSSASVVNIVADYNPNQRLNLANNKKVIIEFGQPNTHKAFHIGHLKSSINGLALANIHEFYGYNVIKANFYGDVGLHVAKTTWGVKVKDLPKDFNLLNPHAKMKVIDARYAFAAAEYKNNPESAAEIKQINKTIYAREPGTDFDLYNQIKEWSLEHLNLAFRELGITYDVQYAESSVDQPSLELVRSHPELFKLDAGAIIFPGKDYGLNTWVLITSEGNPTYEAKDLALAQKKIADYNPDLSIITTSVEQSDHFKAVFKMFGLINPDKANINKHIPFGWMLRDNKKFSSRMGESIKGMDVIEECTQEAEKQISTNKEYSESEKATIARAVGLGGLKFAVLAHEFHKDTNYNPEVFTRFEGFSGPYIMYTYARINSLINNPVGIFPSQNGWQYLTLDSEKALAIKILEFENVISYSVTNLSLHTLCNYLFDLANLFNSYYANTSIVKETDVVVAAARLALAAKVSEVLKQGLNLLGMNVLEKM